MLSAKDIHGVILAIVTPFTSSDEVDIKALKAITRYALEEGVHGIMTTGGNGEFCSLLRDERLYETFQVGDHVGSRRVHDRVQVLNRFLEYDPGYVAPCKFALEILGYAAGRVRAPLPELTQAEQETVRAALAQLGY